MYHTPLRRTPVAYYHIAVLTETRAMFINWIKANRNKGNQIELGTYEYKIKDHFVPTTILNPTLKFHYIASTTQARGYVFARHYLWGRYYAKLDHQYLYDTVMSRMRPRNEFPEKFWDKFEVKF